MKEPYYVYSTTILRTVAMEHIHVEERMAVALVTYAADQKYTGL